MEKKRSKGVIVFVWICLLLSVYAFYATIIYLIDIFHSYPSPLSVKIQDILYGLRNQSQFSLAVFGLLYMNLCSVAMFIGSLFTLKLKKVGIFLLFLSVSLDIARRIIVSLFVYKTFRIHAWSIGEILVLACLCYLFTRPKVKEQFKN